MLQMDANEGFILESLRNMQISNKKPDEMELVQILFGTTNKEIVNLICSILRRSIKNGTISSIDGTVLNPGLSSSNVTILTTVLEYLSTRPVTDQETLERLVSLLDHKDQGIVSLVITILDKAVDACDNVEFFITTIQQLMQVHLDNENIAAFEIVARWCQKSTSVFKACSNSGMIAFATEFSPSRDILLTLTIIELFKDISKAGPGFAFLVQTGVLQKLSLVLFDEDVMELVAVSTIKFWGLVSFHQPDQLELLDSMKIFSRMTEFDSLVLKEAVIVAIGNIGSTSLGLVFLNEQLVLLNFLFPYATGELQVDFLKTLACMLDHRF
jgi:Proteasome non-ATPase 26S subunit